MGGKSTVISNYLEILFFKISESIKAHFGISPIADVIASRIEYAKYLLTSTDYTVSRISLGITPNDDGYLYDSKNREVTFAYENVWVSIRAPKDVTYQTLKSLCKVKSVKID